MDTEDKRLEAAERAGRLVAQAEIKDGHTTPRDWNQDGIANGRVFSHLAAVGFTRLGSRVYSQAFVDAYRKEFDAL